MDNTSNTTGSPRLPQLSTDAAPEEFTASATPRVWFLTDGLSPIALALTETLLRRGDYVVSSIVPEESTGLRGEGLRELLDDINSEGQNEVGDEYDSESLRQERGGRGWRDRLKVVSMDARHVGQTQSAVAEAIHYFGHIDVLLICRSEALVGSIEELAQSMRTEALVRDQFETNFFAPVNVIKSTLPLMREKRNGHIIVITGITAHLGTPGLGMYCASQWAIEGYCDSLAYEIAPFNIKMTIVQPNMEVGILTNKITTVPRLPEYAPRSNRAPLAREILGRILKELPSDETSSNSGITSMYPQLPESMEKGLTSEIAHSLAAIGGKENPPGRLIVGFEGIASVKEKLKTVSEELEDFIEVSEQVDLPPEGGREEHGRKRSRVTDDVKTE